MSDIAKIVPLRGGAPSLNDVVGRLRLLADQIEAGEIENVRAALVLLPCEGDYPRPYGFGDLSGENHPIVICELTKHWFSANLAAREG